MYIIFVKVGRRMESRKVQRAGYSSLSVSLPIDWAKTVGLKQGDTIFLTREKDNSLKLTLHDQLMRKAEAEEFIINSDLCTEKGMLERIIVGNYVIGRDALRIVSSKRMMSEHMKETRGIMRNLIGMSMVEATRNEIFLQCSIDPAKFKLDMLIRRLSAIALTMLEEAIQAVLDFDSQLAKDVILREDEANAMYWLITRLLHSAQRDRTVAEKINLEEPLQIPEDRLISKSIEKIADCAKNMAKRAILLAEYKSKTVSFEAEAVEQLSTLGKTICGMFQKSMESIFSGDIKCANESLELKESIDEKEEKLMQELPSHIYLRSILLCLARIAENSATIAAIAINRALEKPSDLCEPY